MPTKRKSSKPAAFVLAPVDPALKRAWDNLAASLDGLTAQGASAFDDLWEAAARVVDHDPPLYLFGGYKTAGEFFQQRLKVLPSPLRDREPDHRHRRRVVRHFDHALSFRSLPPDRKRE